MYELIQVSERCYYIQSPTKIGLIKTGDNKVCLIDSGNDKDAGKKIKRILEANGWKLDAVYNTHSHADHIGGNQYLQRQTGCRIYAHGRECAFSEYPVMEPAFLYGAFPPKELRHKFLMAQESDVQPLTDECLPEGMKMIALPGHSWDMVGFAVDDGTVYLADCLSSGQTLEKYQISFLVDVKAYLETLEAVQNMEGRVFIPAHAEPCGDIRPLAAKNIEKVYEIADAVTCLCGTPSSFESILRGLFEKYDLTMTFEQHALTGSTVRSYLSWLTEQGRLRPGIENNTLVWSA